jgi:galactose mutarotase-like enzyme
VPFRQTTVAGFPAIALRSEEIEVVAVPAIGMKLTHLRRLRGREWLWRSDSGGWDECFPTVGPSPIPGAPAGTPPLPDGGELWSADWTSSVYEHADGTTLTGTAQGTRLPYEFHREVTLVRGAPAVRFRYRLRHTGVAPFPWIWSAHPLLNVQPGTTLELPGVRQVKLDAVHGRDDLSRDDVVSWPGAIGGAPERFTFPEAGGWAVRLFGDLGRDGRMVLTDPHQGERLEILVDPVAVPQVRVGIDLGGPAPAERPPAYALALAPCIGAPDRLEDAVLAWGTAQMLAPGEERGWEVEVRLPDPSDSS